MKINNTAVFSQQFQITSYKEQIFQNIFTTTLQIEKHYFSLPPFGRIIKLSGTFLDSVVNHLLV